jgi:hypothetical protein
MKAGKREGNFWFSEAELRSEDRCQAPRRCDLTDYCIESEVVCAPSLSDNSLTRFPPGNRERLGPLA